MPTVCTKTESKNSPNDYWYLTVPDYRSQLTASLDTKGVNYSKSATKRGLQAAHVRQQRGFLDYDKCSVEELQRFCSDRRLPPLPEPAYRTRFTHSSSWIKKLLVNHLQAADENLTFRGFGRLGTDLRLMIFEEYFRDLEADTGGHVWDQDAQTFKRCGPYKDTNNSVRAQPPITKTCRDIRTESLPIFYQNCTFRFHISELPNNGRLFLRGPAHRFLSQAPRDVLKQVQNVVIAGHGAYGDDRQFVWVKKIFNEKGRQQVETKSLPEHLPEIVHTVMEQRFAALQGSYVSDLEAKKLGIREHGTRCIQNRMQHRDVSRLSRFVLRREHFDAMEFFLDWIDDEETDSEED